MLATTSPIGPNSKSSREDSWSEVVTVLGSACHHVSWPLLTRCPRSTAASGRGMPRERWSAARFSTLPPSLPPPWVSRVPQESRCSPVRRCYTCRHPVTSFYNPFCSCPTLRQWHPVTSFCDPFVPWVQVVSKEWRLARQKSDELNEFIANASGTATLEDVRRWGLGAGCREQRIGRGDR